MSFVNYFKELLSRPSPAGVNDKYLLIMRSYMEKHLAQVEAAERRVYLTAFRRGLISGLMISLLAVMITLAIIGGN